MVRLMVPSEANFMGNIFGGSILAEVDRVAYVTATRHAGGSCVTASFDRVDFISPVHVGDVVEFIATITSVGRSSMEVWVEVRAEDLKGGPRRIVVNAFVTMVAVDEAGQPRAVPPLTLRNEAERRRAEEARRRMDARRATRPRGIPVPEPN
ncbi:MAG: acyl-CoA thioesterase [Thermoplasmata archaeon]|nr:acyl-CoA thioesterase [Thermoplasmata archaeon]MCI4356924.1 acyl-CoA thioesterase [Thermoplasmata archaeon]